MDRRPRPQSKQPLPGDTKPITTYFKQAGYFVADAEPHFQGQGKFDMSFANPNGSKLQFNDLFDDTDRRQAGDAPWFTQVNIFKPRRPFHWENTDLAAPELDHMHGLDMLAEGFAGRDHVVAYDRGGNQQTASRTIRSSDLTYIRNLTGNPELVREDAQWYSRQEHPILTLLEIMKAHGLKTEADGQNVLVLVSGGSEARWSTEDNWSNTLRSDEGDPWRVDMSAAVGHRQARVLLDELAFRFQAIALCDHNYDGAIDQQDFALWAANDRSTTQLDADGNGDGVINAAATPSGVTQWAGAVVSIAEPFSAASVSAIAVLVVILKMRYPINCFSGLRQGLKCPTTNREQLGEERTPG